MTLVNLNCVFDATDFEDSVSEVYDIIPEKFKKAIEEKLKEASENGSLKNNDVSNYTFLNGLLDS
jgi:hypothetical protein